MRSFVSPTLFALRPYEAGKPIEEVERELGIKDPVKLASNENAWGPSPKAVAAAQGALASLHLYPDAAGFALKAALARSLGVDPATLVLGNGSNELLALIVRTFVQPGDNVVGSAASFIAYKIVTRAVDREYREVPIGPDLGFDLDAMAAAVDARTRVVFVANPNNPTGSFITRADLDRFLADVDRRAGPDGPPLVVLDEAYLEFVDHPAPPDGLAVFRARPRTILTRTFSKAYGLAGLRVGYAVVEPETASFLERVREPFNVNLVGQVAARAALDDEEWVAATARRVREERTRVTAALEARGLRVTPSQANFVLVEVGDGAATYDALLRRGFITRPMAAAGLPRHLRITIGRPDQNDGLIAAFDAVHAAR
ncbi:MAG: histidinol-phosphate transaminase [Deltaproteobacteria bacterium]|nr:histidinol-phosphate transaminase [Deltaproteobacteria bacterium]